MFPLLRKLTIFLSLVVLILMFYEAWYSDSTKAWKNYQKPQVAAYASLDKDEAILKELDRQTRFNSYKALDPSFFVKSNIFEPVEPQSCYELRMTN